MTSQKRTVGDDIGADGPGEWEFNKLVSQKFDEHVRKSVPGYAEAHDIISKVSDFFLSNGSVFIELGCSTGTLTRLIAERHAKKDIVFLGVDNQADMISEAKRKTADPRIEFKIIDAIDCEYASSFVCSVFTIQFVPPKYRQLLVDKIYEEMDWGGGFCFFEKVRGSDARFQDILMSMHWEWKMNQGFSDQEIIGKWRSLKAVMEPFSENGNLELLKRAGFRDIETIWKWGPFQGFLAIK